MHLIKLEQTYFCSLVNMLQLSGTYNHQKDFMYVSMVFKNIFQVMEFIMVEIDNKLNNTNSIA